MINKVKVRPKGHRQCFNCPKTTTIKDGDWYNWESQQVWLCGVCEKDTRDGEKRNPKKS